MAVAKPEHGRLRLAPRSIKAGETAEPAFEVVGEDERARGIARWRIGDSGAEITIGWSLAGAKSNAFAIHCDDPSLVVASDGVQYAFAQQCLVTFSLDG